MQDSPCDHAGWTLLFEYTTDFHDRFMVFHCPGCQQHYLLNSWERIDWEAGRDRQYSRAQALSASDVEAHRQLAAQWGPG